MSVLLSSSFWADFWHWRRFADDTAVIVGYIGLALSNWLKRKAHNAFRPHYE